MAPPAKQIDPKSREKLWRETIMGGILFVFGMVLVWQYVGHSEHGHDLDTVVLWVGVGFISTGLFMTNKKLAKEWFDELRKFVPFLKAES